MSSKATMQATMVTQLATAGWTQSTGPSGGGSQTVTLTIASPGVVNLTAHGLVANDQVIFATTGALPTGISAGTVYFVKTVLTSGTFTIAATAGGTVIAFTGSQSGTQTMVSTVRMDSAATPWGVKTRVKMQDNAGACLTFSLENSISTLVGGSSSSNNGCFLLPGATAFRILANQYQCFVFTPITTGARQYVAFGTLYLPTFLQGVLTECGWMECNSAADNDTTPRTSFRTILSSTGQRNLQCIANGSLLEVANAGGNNGNLFIAPARGVPGDATGQTGLHWHDSSALMLEPLVGWATSAVANEALLRGQLWGAVVIEDTFTGDATTTFDSHNWWNVTDNNTGAKQSLFIITS